MPSFKNRMFDICLLTTFVAIGTNILSTLMIYNLGWLPVWLTWLVTTVYFVATPLMGTVYFFYILAVFYEGDPRIKRYLWWSSLPAVVYLADVLLNPFTGAIFTLSREEGYLRGPRIASTYLVFYLYCVVCLVISLRRNHRVEVSIQRILTIFPLVAAVVILVQQAFPTYVLSGSAATCALLIVYLYLQNKRLSIDYLTGISNRQEFLQMLAYKMRSRRFPSFTVVVVSLNQFKVINDKLGQHNGDRLLQQLSAFLKTEGTLGSLYRYSGDEFAILLDTVEEETIQNQVARITTRMENSWSLDSYDYVMSCSVGIVEYPATADDVSGLINGIEYAVDQAKADKVEKVCFCTSQMLEQFRRRSQILEILQERLATDGFEVYLQPILHTGTQRFVAAEALLRLQNTPLGTISPGEFIPLAEESGIIIDITYQLLEKVCRQIASLNRAGTAFDWISVNLSVLQLMQPNLPEKLCAIIKGCGVPFSKVKLEITESVLAASYQKVEEFIRAMDKVGIRCALDDFGTGYSNIAMSIQLPLDTIKLDQSLVWSGIRDNRAAVIVHNMAKAIRQLGIHVVAEGVETPEQARFVEDCGCDLIQGFLYARPMPFEEARAYFEKP